MLTVGLNPHNRVFVFAGPVMAALCTFVSESVWARIARSIALVRWVQPVVRGAASAPFFWLCVVFFGTLAWWGEPRGALRAFREETIIVIFKVGGPVFLTILASAFWSLRRSGGILATPLVGHRPGWAFWVGVAVFAHQALMIAGLNSKAHFNMASNFSVSPAFSSHLLFRAPHWGFNEPVRLLDSSSKRLKRLRSDRRGFPWLYFSDLVARYPNASVRYSVGNSEAVRISRVGDHPELFRSSVYAWAFKGYPVPLKRQTLRCSHIAPQNRKSRRTGRRSKHR